MIVLAFRSAEAHRQGVGILAAANVPFGAEAPSLDCCSHLIWLFQDDVRSARQREALSRVRSLEPQGRRLPVDLSVPNLATPL